MMIMNDDENPDWGLNKESFISTRVPFEDHLRPGKSIDIDTRDVMINKIHET